MIPINIPNRSTGFTLIEVLVAAVILFASIATVSMVYRGAFLSSEKAEQHVKLTGMMPVILSDIKEFIQQNGKMFEEQLSSTGNAWGVKYVWVAQSIAFKGAPEKLDVDNGDYITPPLKYRLWLVNLTVEYKSLEKSFQFHEISWTND